MARVAVRRTSQTRRRRTASNDRRETIARSLLTGVRSYLDSLNRTQSRQLTDAARRSTVAQGSGRTR